jgi:serine/threonine protein phosphatase PrpC
MGAFLDKPMTDKTTEYGEGNCLKYGLSAMQGWRKDMEDAHICSTKLESEWKDWSVFGVFDGHAGASVSSYLSEYLVQTIQECTTLVGEGEVLIKNVKEGIKKSFMKIDSKLKKEPGFINGSERAGSTAIVVLVSPTVIVWANCGDSRGFLCRNRKVFWTTEDHKPLNAKEKLRIERAGGTVINQRVNGTLAVSRAIGDFEYKQNGAFKDEEQLVSAEPDVSHIMRHPDDEFIFLACDGVYDVMSNDEIAAFIQLRLSMTDKLPDICSSLIDTCLHKNSRDNMSAILVTLPGAPSPSEESIAEVSLQVHKPLLPFLLPIHAYMFLIFWNYCCSVLQMQWSLVYSTTSVPHRMCRINQVLDKSG